MAPNTPSPNARGTPSTESGSSATTNDRDINQMRAAFNEMGARIIELESKTNSQKAANTPREVKIGTVTPFKGERGTLKVYLAQIRLYFMHNSERLVTESDKVLAASSFLDGEAMKWFAPYITDWYQASGNDEQRNPETITMFSSYRYYEEKLNQLWGTVNEEIESVNKIKHVRQWTSVGEYISKFLQTSGGLSWNDQGYRDQFYEGLKDNVKDRISMMTPRPETFQAMMEAASQIDLTIYTRRMERGDFKRNNRSNTAQRRTKDRDGDTIMQLNMTKEEKKKLMKDKRCFNCGKPGHFANKCRQPKQNSRLATSGSKEQIATMIPMVNIDAPTETSLSENEADDEKDSDNEDSEFRTAIQEEEQQLERLANYERVRKEWIQESKNDDAQKRLKELLNQIEESEGICIKRGMRFDWMRNLAKTNRVCDQAERIWINEFAKHYELEQKERTSTDARMGRQPYVSGEETDQPGIFQHDTPMTAESSGGAEKDANTTGIDAEDFCTTGTRALSPSDERLHALLTLRDDRPRTITYEDPHREQDKNPAEEETQRTGLDEYQGSTNEEIENANTESSGELDDERTWLEATWPQGEEPCSCTSAKATCWEDSQQTWINHIEDCEKCEKWTYHKCRMHGQANVPLARQYEQISYTRGVRLCNDILGHVRNCSCLYYPTLGGNYHYGVHWSTCYDQSCQLHIANKERTGWFPRTPGILDEPKMECPLEWIGCQCVCEEATHPFHDYIQEAECQVRGEEGHPYHLHGKGVERFFELQRQYYQRHMVPTEIIAMTLTAVHQTITILATIGKANARILLDSGATNNYISQRFVDSNQIPTVTTKEWVQVVGINGQILTKGYKEQTEDTLVKSGKYATTLAFDIVPMSDQYYDAVVGMAWLKEQNPIIDWTTGKVAVDMVMLTTKIDQRDIGKIAQLHEESGKALGEQPKDAGASRKARKQERKVSFAENIEYIKKEKNEATDETKIIGPEKTEVSEKTKMKPTELYQQERAEVLKILPKKYLDFMELFVKKEYKLPTHKAEFEARIELREGFMPPSAKQRHKSRDELKLEDEFIDKFLEAGYIRPGHGSASALPMFVDKKDGTERMVIDYRALNNGTIDDANKAPHQEQKRDLLQGAKVMTVFDVQWGYYNLRMFEGDIWKTAFLTDKGLFEWVVAPMGLKNLPAQFARFMTATLWKFLNKFVAVYFDDVIVFSKNVEEHEGHVRQVMTALMNAGLTLKIKKCKFDTTTVDYLGMVYTPEGLKIQPEKMDAIINWPTPTTVNEIQQFLGATGYVRRYLKNYAGTTRPMTELLRKDQEFDWSDARQQAFENVKKLVKEAPILMLHDPERPSTVRPDASGYALGIVLEQPGDDGKLRPVAFYSRQFTAAERNYDVHDRELLAVVEAFKQWRHYLQGAKEETIVRSDHHNLKYFTTTKELTGRQIRWAEYLSRFKFRIEHIKGKENVIADALSRRPDYAIGLEQPRTNILVKDDDGIRYNTQAILAMTITVESGDFHEKFVKATERDKVLSTALQNHEAIRENGLAIWRGSILVPAVMITEIIQMHHDLPTEGHPGIERTIEKIQRNYYFPRMRKLVEEYIKKCENCNRNKPINHQPYGKMKIPETPTKAWQHITIDFIQGLPESRDPISGIAYTNAIVIVDKLTKYVIMKPVPKNLTAAQCATLMLREVFTLFGLPNEITSDRDKLFTSKFWQTITRNCGVRHNLSTAYHQQTDGQTERMIQAVEQYLRHYLDWNQDNWVELLPIAQFAMNNARNASTGQVPHFANLGRMPRMSWDNVKREGASNEANIQATYMQLLHSNLSKDIEWAEMRMKKYYDKKREDAPTLRRGERVYLLRRTPGSKEFNVRSKRPSNKFDAVKFGPFAIKEKLENDNYRLQLPARMRIHPIFHISLLEPTQNQTNEDEAADDEEYEVERLLQRKLEKGHIFYLVRWKGYGPEEDSWEPVRHLNCPEKIQEFRRDYNQAKQKDRSRGRSWYQGRGRRFAK